MLSKDYAFRSQRLKFRGIRREDADHIVAWRSDPENYMNFLTAKPITKESHLEWFQDYLNDPTRFDFIIMDQCGMPIGTCGLSDITEDKCEISYMIGVTNARGNGYAAEAIEAFSKVAFEVLGVTCIEAQILPHNIASIKAAERCGYRKQDNLYRLCRQQFFHNIKLKGC